MARGPQKVGAMVGASTLGMHRTMLVLYAYALPVTFGSSMSCKVEVEQAHLAWTLVAC